MSEPTRTTVHVVRHGEVYNPGKILYGRLPDFHLSELGRQMAKADAQALADRDVTHVVASPLERAQETAEPIAAQFGLEIASDIRLIESANFFEGKKVSPGDGAFSNPRNWWVLRDPITPSWGEAYLVIAQRMFAAVQAASLADPGLVGRVLGDPEGRRSVEELLAQQRAAAHELLDANRHLVEALRDALLERHELVGSEITDVLEAAQARHS